MNKKDRLSAILNLINEFEISTQDELTDKLNELGYNVSQATVSRDINTLNLSKGEGVSKKTKYIKAISLENTVPQKTIDLFKHITISIVQANNLIILKTISGNAASAGMVVDQMHLPQILGTVAGDDTLLIIAKNDADAELILKSLRSI